MASALDQVISTMKDFQGGIENTGNLIGRGVRAVYNEFANNPQTIAQDYPFRIANLQQKFQSATKEHDPFEPTAFMKHQLKMYQEAPQRTKMAMDAILGDQSYTPESHESGFPTWPSRFFLEPPIPNSQEITNLKNTFLNDQSLLPGTKNYLNRIPATLQTNKFSGGASAFADPQYKYVSFTQTGQKLPSQYQNEAMRHELLHQTGYVVLQGDKINEFADKVTQAVAQNPQAFAPLMAWLDYYKKAAPEKMSDPQYFGKELFAQIGATFGPSILQNPYLGSYYKSIFAEPSGRAKIRK